MKSYIESVRSWKGDNTVKRRKYLISFVTFAIFILFFPYFYVNGENTRPENEITLNETKTKQIETLIEKHMEDGKIPGIAVTIIDKNGVSYQKEFGYADLEKKIPVESDTLFELGSTTKAFTGLAVLKLEQEEKINLNDSVKQYIPGFTVKYKEQDMDITLRQLLYHTSGIAFESIGDIPISDSEDALAEVVELVTKRPLNFRPGTKFLYATANYDVLGLVIENVTGLSYEEYMKTNILTPLGLTNTHMSREEVQNNMSKGYKINLLKPREYHAPTYRGNTPAGYIIIDIEDLTEWIKIQLGMNDIDDFYKQLIEQSHRPDRMVSPTQKGTSYAAGWNVVQDGRGELFHPGENPNFSSYVVFRPEEQLGVGVLANINSSFTPEIGQGIMNIIMEKQLSYNTTDTMIYFDFVFFLVIMVSVPLIISNLFLLIRFLLQLFKGQRKRTCTVKKAATYLGLMIVFLTVFGVCLYKIPEVIFEKLPWSFLQVWAPQIVIPAVILAFLAVFLFCLLYVTTTIFSKRKEKSYFIISILSIANGFGNAVMIFTINASFAQKVTEFQSGLFLIFLNGLFVYIYGQRIVRVKLLEITNDLVYEKRIMMINNILKAPFEKVQNLEDGRIQACLNNDTQVISVFANVIVTALTSVVTLICCMVYLSFINFWGFLLSTFAILIAAAAYFYISRNANKIYERTRDIENVFFTFINDLSAGFKELKINDKRQDEFHRDMEEICDDYRNQKIKAALAFANVFVMGELLFVVIIGLVVFVFPLIFKTMNLDQLRNYVFVFLYITGPVKSILNAIPETIHIKIGLSRIKELIEELNESEPGLSEEYEAVTTFEKLKLEDIRFSYTDIQEVTQENHFKIGPISCEFKAGEITFITGGNGSGKSTLGYILTGLYCAQSGRISINEEEVSTSQIRKYYSAVFSNPYIFQKMYGIDSDKILQEAKEILRMLRMEDKVEIKDGAFSTTKLSSGQRKRLGLLLAYLEDYDIYFFDEWAADQEPAFRDFFYNHLLLNLQKNGKCVIAITHDDRYFDVADKVIEMELGLVKNIRRR